MKNTSSNTIRIFLVFFSIFLCPGILGFGKITGKKEFRNFTPSDYEQQPQNWCIAQDKQGIIYAGNNAGLLQYDGVAWRLLPIPNKVVKSLAVDGKGTIYVGGKNAFGYMTTNAVEGLKYKSLLPELQKIIEPEENENPIGNVYRTQVASDGIYFRTPGRIYRWNPGAKKMKTWSPPGEDSKFSGSFVCNGQYYVHVNKAGLMIMKSDRLELLRGGEKFTGRSMIFLVAGYGSGGGGIIIGARDKGFFIYDGNGMEPFPTELDQYVNKKRVSYGIQLKSFHGYYAIATLQGGLVVMNQKGELEYKFTKADGLQSNNVKWLFEDKWGNLWLALEKGITKIKLSSPFTYYDEYSDLSGLVFSVLKHKQMLYAGTSFGLHYLALPAEKSAKRTVKEVERFKTIPGIYSSCWSLASMDDSVIVANSLGIFQVTTTNRPPKKLVGTRAFVLVRSKRDPGRIWAGITGGLVSLRFDKKSKAWDIQYLQEEITRTVRSIAEDVNGDLWIGGGGSGVERITFADFSNIKKYSIKKFAPGSILPEGEIRLFQADGWVRFCTGKGIYYCDKKKDEIVPDNFLGDEFTGGKERAKEVYTLCQNRDRSIWISSSGRTFLAKPEPGGGYKLSRSPFWQLPIAQVNNFHQSGENKKHIAWFATFYGLFRYNADSEVSQVKDSSTLIRKIVVNGELLTRAPGVNRGPQPRVFDYSQRSFRFEVASPFFENESRTAYWFFLDGYDDNWAKGDEPVKIYTNLNPGTYTFRTKSKNIYDRETKESVFHFKILPPWYRTVWAYGIYIVAFFALIYIIVRWRSIRHEKERKRLEMLVGERTKEVIQKNHQLEEQSKKLKELDHAKSLFFANISHEFRTPLTLLIDPLHRFYENTRDPKEKKTINRMRRSAYRLLALINRLLDLSKLDSGKMELEAANQNFTPFLKGIVSNFEHLCDNNQISLQLTCDIDPLSFYFDAEKLTEVFYNIIINAVKYTPCSGRISVTVSRCDEPVDDFPQGYVEISIKDTGMGISQNQLKHIFDRFHQADASFKPEHKYKGSGIGLSLTRELVMLHHGKIEVHSKEAGQDRGTEFNIRLPLGRSHLNDSDIVLPSRDVSSGDSGSPGLSEMSILEEVENGCKVNAAGESAALEEEKGNGKPTILVIEDNFDMRQYIRESLGDEFHAVEAEDGETGMKKAESLMPDLIVSDIMMPGIPGDTLCRELKEKVVTSHIPIILLTAKDSEEDKLTGLKCGADDYITKPFNTEHLLTRIRNLIELRSQLQERSQKQMLLQPSEIKVSPVDRDFIRLLHEKIEVRMADEDFTVEQLSEDMEMVPVTLNKKIKALSGETAKQFIRSYRLKRAMQLLKKTRTGNIVNVVEAVGFASHAYFTKCFKDKFNQSPSEFLMAEPAKAEGD